MRIETRIKHFFTCSENCKDCRIIYDMPSKRCCLDACKDCDIFSKAIRKCKNGGVFSNKFLEDFDNVEYKRLKKKYENRDNME